MKALFFFVLTCWYMPCAAYTVTGHIREQKTERPMEFADVALYRAADSVLVAGSVADSEGCFAFGSVAAGSYYVKYGLWAMKRAVRRRLQSGNSVLRI